MKKESPLILIGSGGQAHDVNSIINAINRKKKTWDLIGFIDDDQKLKNKNFCNKMIFGDVDWLKNSAYDKINVNVAIGDCKPRKLIVEKISFKKFKFPNLIHPSSVVTEETILGIGDSIHGGVVFGSNSNVGDHCIFLYNSTVGHDTQIGDFVTVCPGVHINGYVTIGSGTFIGSGTVIKQGVKIGRNSVIGLGSVVMDDIPDNVIATGQRARPVKKNY